MTRILTAAIGLPLVVVVTYWGPAWLFAGLVALTSTIALDEFLNLTATGERARTGRWFLPFGGAVTMSFFGGPAWVVAGLSLTLLVLMTATLTQPVAATADRFLGGAGGLAYVSILIGFLILLPREAVLTLFGIVWAGDTAAYYGGRTMGRHRLAPRISPNKTVEGAVSGAVASAAVGLLLAVRLMELPPSTLLGVSILGTAVAGQVGDLFESAMKRSAEIKDSSTLLPGHGGMLDRIDSLLFAAPVFYFLLLLI